MLIIECACAGYDSFFNSCHRHGAILTHSRVSHQVKDPFLGTAGGSFLVLVCCFRSSATTQSLPFLSLSPVLGEIETSSDCNKRHARLVYSTDA